MDKKIIEHEQRISDNEKQIALIVNKLQIEQIAQKLLMRKRMNLHRLADARKKFTPNLLDKFTPNLLSTALAEHNFFLPQMPLISAEDFLNR